MKKITSQLKKTILNVFLIKNEKFLNNKNSLNFDSKIQNNKNNNDMSSKSPKCITQNNNNLNLNENQNIQNYIN